MRESLLAQIVLDQMDKVYQGGVQALDDLNPGIGEGEFMVLVGLSGFGQRVVNDRPRSDRDIAMVGRNYVLYPRMTVAENLAFGLKLRNVPRAEIKRRVTTAARVLGLGPYLSRQPATLSRGQRQRVAMGRAIVRGPQAFLILGIHPSDFEDAAFGAAPWARFPVTVSVTENLGTEIHAIVPIDAPPAVSRSPWGARLPARSVARPGQPLELAVDPRALHFFDPVSGATIGARRLSLLKAADHLLAEQLDVRDVGRAVDVEVHGVGALARQVLDHPDHVVGVAGDPGGEQPRARLAE
jgi:ABC-type sugar transport system ATPase subunit